MDTGVQMYRYHIYVVRLDSRRMGTGGEGHIGLLVLIAVFQLPKSLISFLRRDGLALVARRWWIGLDKSKLLLLLQCMVATSDGSTSMLSLQLDESRQLIRLLINN